jgi:eukaryotic-like serine/threonine-protein kinase
LDLNDSLRTFAEHGETTHETTFWAAGPLPPDLVRDASRRLGIASSIFALSFVLAWFAAPPEARPAGSFPMLDVALATAVALSLAVFIASRLLEDDTALLTDVGLMYEVAFCFMVALAEQWNPWDLAQAPRGISWVCLALVVFPLTVPSTPGKTLLASFLSATTGPVALAIAVAKGNPLPSPAFWLELFLPVYLAAGGAYFLSRIIYKLTRDVTTARQLGSYELIERLGSGGMGEVWRARHRLLARPAAVKLVRPELLGDPRLTEIATIRRRFEHEAQATASLESPHTISVYDYGTTADGTFYYVMELLDGLDLETLVRRFGRLPPERAIHVLRQVCLSLAEAHQRGMIHRDIKPANIYLCRRGIQYDFVKVLDFGLVISDPAAEKKLTRLTAKGFTSGTPTYMAPEMLDSTKQIDARADIYALGCLGYWMVTGELVFDGPSAIKIMAEHASARPKPPSERIGAPLPPDLEDQIMSCLEKEPSLRPSSARELEAMLARCNNADDWTEARAEAWWKSNAPEQTPIDSRPKPS